MLLRPPKINQHRSIGINAGCFFYGRTEHDSFITQNACIHRETLWQLQCSGKHRSVLSDSHCFLEQLNKKTRRKRFVKKLKLGLKYHKLFYLGLRLEKQYRHCTYNVTLRRVRESLLPWKSNKYYWLVCVCACAYVRVRALMWVPGSLGVCMRIRACSLTNPACNAYAPYCDVIYGPSVSTTFFDIIS